MTDTTGGGDARAAFLGLDFDRLALDEALAWCAARPADARFAYVVTPNVDHVVRLDREAAGGAVRAAYAAAALCLCDSRILARLAALSGLRLAVVPGSDLTQRLFSGVVGAGDRIAIVGGDALTVPELLARHPGLDIVQHIPPMGVRDDAAAMAAAARFVGAARARFTLLAIGSPQQELLAHRIATAGGAAGTGLCIGASIDFLTARKTRAPLWMRRAGIEWLHRLASEPRRLWRRYLIEGPRIFVLAWRRRRGG